MRIRKHRDWRMKGLDPTLVKVLERILEGLIVTLAQEAGMA
jgi:hypothetical protein